MEKKAKNTNIPIENMVSEILKTDPTDETNSRVRVILSKEGLEFAIFLF
jgi:hypothetical protein